MIQKVIQKLQTFEEDKNALLVETVEIFKALSDTYSEELTKEEFEELVRRGELVESIAQDASNSTYNFGGRVTTDIVWKIYDRIEDASKVISVYPALVSNNVIPYSEPVYLAFDSDHHFFEALRLSKMIPLAVDGKHYLAEVSSLYDMVTVYFDHGEDYDELFTSPAMDLDDLISDIRDFEADIEESSNEDVNMIYAYTVQDAINDGVNVPLKLNISNREGENLIHLVSEGVFHDFFDGVNYKENPTVQVLIEERYLNIFANKNVTAKKSLELLMKLFSVHSRNEAIQYDKENTDEFTGDWYFIGKDGRVEDGNGNLILMLDEALDERYYLQIQRYPLIVDGVSYNGTITLYYPREY